VSLPASHVDDPLSQLNFEWIERFFPKKFHGPFVGGGTIIAPAGTETLTFNHNLGIKGTQVVVGFVFDGAVAEQCTWRASTGADTLIIVTRNGGGINAAAGWRGVILEF
jgi:hypothetical protein